MIRILAGLLVMLTSTLSAQEMPKGPHLTLNIVASDPDTLAGDDNVIYVKSSGETQIAVTRVAGDSTLMVTDADGSDGGAAVSIPEGYSIFAKVSGKPGGKATLGGTSFERAKGKKAKVPQYQNVTDALSGDSWTLQNDKASAISLRLFPPAE